MNGIIENKAKVWNERVRECMDQRGLTQDEFAKAFKKVYAHGKQSDISRWTRVHETITNRQGKMQKIGFPNHETMLEIAEFFDVSIGYLLGETDYKTFDSQRTCEYLGIDEKTGDAIKGLVGGHRIEPFGYYFKKHYAKVISLVFTSDYFGPFIKKIDRYGELLYKDQHPKNRLQELREKLNNDSLFDEALKYVDYTGFEEDELVLDDSVINLVQKMNSAIESDMEEQDRTEWQVKLAKYEITETVAKLVEDIVQESNLSTFKRQ